jgi:hypothetical protein
MKDTTPTKAEQTREIAALRAAAIADREELEQLGKAYHDGMLTADALLAQTIADRETIGELRVSLRDRVIRLRNFESEGSCDECGAAWESDVEKHSPGCLAALPGEEKKGASSGLR